MEKAILPCAFMAIIHHWIMDADKLRKALDSDLDDIRAKKDYSEGKTGKGDVRRLLIAAAIALMLTSSLALVFIILSSAGNPPSLSVKEQKELIETLDGLCWECSDREALYSLLSIGTAKEILTWKSGGSLILDLGTIAVPFVPSDDGLCASIGRDTAFLYYSEGADGNGRTITISTSSVSASFFVPQ